MWSSQHVFFGVALCLSSNTATFLAQQKPVDQDGNRQQDPGRVDFQNLERSTGRWVGDAIGRSQRCKVSGCSWEVGKHPLNLGMTSRGYCWWLSNLAPGWLGTVVILADGPHESAWIKVFAEQRSKRAIVYPMIYWGFIDVMQGF